MNGKKINNSTPRIILPRSLTPVPLLQRYVRALKWAKRAAVEYPDLERLVEMARIESALRQG